jgi:hypothetical protein
MGFAANNNACLPLNGSAESANGAAPENHNQAPMYGEPPVTIGKMFYTVEEADGALMEWRAQCERTRRKAIPHRRLRKYVRSRRRSSYDQRYSGQGPPNEPGQTHH